MITVNRMAPDFVSLNRALTAAEDLAAWQPAQAAMDRFLDDLEATLNAGAVAAWSPDDAAKVFSLLLTLMAESGQYRHETYPASGDAARYQMLSQVLLPGMARLRRRAVQLAKTYLSLPVFKPLAADLQAEIFPLLESMTAEQAPDRFMPFRVIQVGNVYERLCGFPLRTEGAELRQWLHAIYERKYLRFGTSGVRGRWGHDFTGPRAKQVIRAVCDFLKNKDVPAYVGAEDLSGKRVVIGYDSRLNARLVAEWVAEICLANGFTVDLAYRDSPTPALVYYLTDHLPPDEVAGLINCTASHNPPEWQGLKFNPRLGYPAPTNVTDFIAARINEIQLLDQTLPGADLPAAMQAGRLRGFDPIDLYTHWILESGHGNRRISIDWERLRKFFGNQLVVIDEMYGAGRGYLARLLGEIGIRYTVIHAETDPTLPGLDYANPEEPYINTLKAKVKETGAVLGLGTDTDADRFGVVDQGGVYLRPNQLLPMLVRYLGIERGLTGRVIATQTGSPLIEPLAGQIAQNAEFKPEANIIPAYVDHPFYRRRLGKRESRVYVHTFMVPVGIKYIEEQRRTDRRYRNLRELPEAWRDILLIGGEESSGLTTRGHVTDKDGIWANLLVMDMLAHYGAQPGQPPKTLTDIWRETCAQTGCWVSYGGREDEGSNSGRTDVDAVLEAKEAIINDYLDRFAEDKPDNRLAGLEVVYAGGVRYDIVELQLRDADGNDQNFLRIRSSGTEPINRFYLECARPATASLLRQTVLNRLEELVQQEILLAHSPWRLADVLTVTQVSPRILETVRAMIKERQWPVDSVAAPLTTMASDAHYLEGRNKRAALAWVEALRGV